MFNHTSVPCDNPDILSNSSNVLGFVSTNIPLTNLVPNSGTPNVATSEFISSFLTPIASVDENIDIVALSSNGTFVGSIPVKS